MSECVADYLLYVAADEIFDLAAVGAHEVMVVVVAFGELVERSLPVNVYLAHDTLLLEGLDHAIDGHLVAYIGKDMSDVLYRLRGAKRG